MVKLLTLIDHVDQHDFIWIEFEQPIPIDLAISNPT